MKPAIYSKRSDLGLLPLAALSAALVLLSIVVVVPASGQEAGQEPVDEFEEEIFVEGSAGTAATSSSVATKVAVPLRLTPASVGVVTEALSAEQGNQTLSDALRNVSGVNVQEQVGRMSE